MLLTACIKNNEYDGNIGPSEIRESQTTNEVALTNLNLAIAYLTENNYDKALEKLNKSLAADSNYAPTYNIFGLLYQQLGDNDKAEKNFKRALSINSVDSSTLNNYGNFLCTLGRLGEAEKSFSKARRSIVAKKRIEKGEILNENNLTTKRPGDGLSPMEWDSIIDTVAKKNFDEDDLIEK